MTARSALACGVVAVLLASSACRSTSARAYDVPEGVITWAASADRMGAAAAADRGYRLVVHTSVAGRDLRIRLTNAFGDRPVTFDNVYAGIQQRGAELVPGSNRRLTFDGSPSVTVPAGEVVLSDPLPGSLPAATNLVISFHSPDAAGPATGHWMALQTSYATQGDHTAEESATHWTQAIGSWFYLDAVSVRAAARTGAVVTLGDSITDGWQSTSDLNRRWPDHLARRLLQADTHVKGVANAGMAGNKVLTDGPGQSALNRLERDVLSQPGVRTVFLFQGVNDIKAYPGVTAEDLIDGYREIVERVHAAGKCVVAATVLPFKGWSEWEAGTAGVRHEVNAFIRNSGEFDAVTDFDRVLRSPQDPERILPVFDSGDHLHPNDKGMRAMADAVDLQSLDCADPPGTDATP
ncbi:G-D-S-L family lipolytic protein [Streptomyces sp. SA15]|uniref:SGNH/GDSL hydrolase family protein n=1 Tax=Streptomyces sp. SA15 TaxID=934019 RepID=UPI000BAEB07F|nr:SGNH/GDSL hydrolase family protein [Streptomyces sp. SA15]PAZ09091.1 G-D-S-L family lipolytic protein [Streptomyces sp. SA15]